MAAPLIIVGTGMAGYGLLRALRQIDRKMAVSLYTCDDGAAYSKFQLACALARGRDAGDLVLATAEQMAHRFDASVHARSRVRGLDRARHLLITDSGAQRYHRVVLAVGAEPIRPRLVRGTAATRMLSFSGLGDYRYLRSELAGRRQVAVLGGDAPACELAESLVRAGCEVRLLESASRLLGGRVPGLCAERIERRLQTAGVRVMLDEGVQRIDQGFDKLEITTLSGAYFVVDVVIAALGHRPRTELAHAAGLAVARGIVVDGECRTGDPEIFALGECAEMTGHAFRLADDIEAGARVLATVLAGGHASMHWPSRLQRLQLECCPTVLCEPPPGAGEWQETATRRGVQALFHDRRGGLRGFALIGDAVSEAARLHARLSR